VDGDPSCDADGMSNGVCAVQVSVCIEQPLNGCTPTPVSHVQVVAPRQLRHALPKHPAIGPGCRSLGTLQLPMIRRRGRPRGPAEDGRLRGAGSRRTLGDDPARRYADGLRLVL